MRTSILLALLLPACQDYEIKSDNDYISGTEEEGEPDITVTPDAITFGEMAVGADVTAVQTVTVMNEGTQALEIRDLRLADDDMASVYTISAIGAVLIPPGQSTTFTVTFLPATAVDSLTDVLIDSNDPDEPEVVVPITGTGIAPVIQLTPTAYDYGTMYIGCDEASAVEIRNVGNADLIVDDFSYVSASNDLEFDEDEAVNGPLPWTLAPGEFLNVYVDYAPLDDYTDSGYLTVSSNDPFRPEIQSSQSGNGALYGENLDVYEQPVRTSSDILFVIDNSCSMADEQSNLENNFTYFASGLTSLDLDYQMAIITTDNPAFRGDIMTPETSDLEDEFIAQAACGTGGSGNEMPSEMAYQSTQDSGDAGKDGDFLRDDSMLSMIFVSDEPDSSPSAWADYLSWFEGLKDDSDNLVVHAISGDWPTGCADASATNNVYEMTVATGGLYLSVCATDWSSHLEALVQGSAQDLSSFDLTQWPVPETIQVRIDGINTTTGWSWNEADNSVDFEESSIPEGGATIEIEYALMGDCEE
jgi:hypothetical protein